MLTCAFSMKIPRQRHCHHRSVGRRKHRCPSCDCSRANCIFDFRHSNLNPTNNVTSKSPAPPLLFINHHFNYYPPPISSSSFSFLCSAHELAEHHGGPLLFLFAGRGSTVPVQRAAQELHCQMSTLTRCQPKALSSSTQVQTRTRLGMRLDRADRSGRWT